MPNGQQQAPAGGSSTSGGPPTGSNLPPPPLPGSGPQPTNAGKPPGWAPIHFALVQSFLTGANPNTVDIEAVDRAAARFADALLSRYPGYVPGVTLPKT